ncbi:mitochondrial intermembrane space import and assembly protein 40 [Diaporthe helianthi]|uniref:Mitochondrial intermembrane space import and assembly protein 40 n=1 Tax=Diaporthe helianthi TaxID=158607 RepID=A0A2P5HN47_DIAHE|nr:mitochondrial intermembrane space import and assembly protein 40 [Diaporthe helianthi]
MFRAAVRSTPRALRQPSFTIASAGRRFASTAPADKRYTWKGTAARWGLAVGALYWYNTSPMFADEMPPQLSNEPPQFAESELQTVDAIVEEKRKQIDQKLKARDAQATRKAEAANNATPQQTSPTPPPTDESATVAPPSEGTEKTPEQLEEEAGQQGAFNPETGEINWDCPCLGGMAHGPCGEEFKAAFSCFVYSNEEPKGIECVEKFQGMQDCFRKYPDIYGAEIADEEAAEHEAEQVALDTPTPSASDDAPAPAPKTERKMAASPADTDDKPAKSKPSTTHEKAADKKSDVDADVEPISEERGVPEKAFDATGANKKA